MCGGYSHRTGLARGISPHEPSSTKKLAKPTDSRAGVQEHLLPAAATDALGTQPSTFFRGHPPAFAASAARRQSPIRARTEPPVGSSSTQAARNYVRSASTGGVAVFSAYTPSLRAIATLHPARGTPPRCAQHFSIEILQASTIHGFVYKNGQVWLTSYRRLAQRKDTCHPAKAPRVVGSILAGPRAP